MKDSKPSSKSDKLSPLNPNDEPPHDRFCDVVLDGGVINGVVYPGFLIELARKFRFRSIGGTSVGAISGAFAAACEYNRRYQSNNGFNEGLAKMPAELAGLVDDKNEITKIRSLFQPDPKVQRLFDWFVDVLGISISNVDKEVAGSQKRDVSEKSTMKELLSLWQLTKVARTKALDYFGPKQRERNWWVLASLCVVLILEPVSLFWKFGLWAFIFVLGVNFLHPLWIFIGQIRALIKLPGAGACTGRKTPSSNAEGLTEWLYEGVQKAANLPMHQPLTFKDLWHAPSGPKDADGNQEPRSIDLRMITTCLSHGRIYEMPLVSDAVVLMFKLTELEPYFPPEVISHLRRVSKRMDVDSCDLLQKRLYSREKYFCPKPNSSTKTTQQTIFEDKVKTLKAKLKTDFDEPENSELGLKDPNIRELPYADLPIVVAARLSMSVPILFQNIPLIGFNLDEHIEDTDLVRLWFSDGGIGSNFPIHLFDKPLPRWPTFGMKILDEPPRKNFDGSPTIADMPYSHADGSDDNLLYPKDKEGFTSINGKNSFASFIKVLFSVYTSAKDGHDQSFLRMPDVRNRIVRVYMNRRAGNMLNLKIEPEKIRQLAVDVGAYSGRLAANAYLADAPPLRYKWVNSWQDHRWVRFTMLTNGLRHYLNGFTHVSQLKGLPDSKESNTLIDQVLQATQKPPLASRSDPSDEVVLTQEQSSQLLEIIDAISKLEKQLQALDIPLPYSPEPMPVLRFKPTY